jgi:bifunctional enzyme CysN/CysC
MVRSAKLSELLSEPSLTMNELLDQQRSQGSLRFIACGSTGHGKSTLVGRLLRQCDQMLEAEPAEQAAKSKARRNHNHAVDSLDVEGTNDGTLYVAAHPFTTSRRRFVALDAPGQVPLTRNMVAAASTADVAVLVVDAFEGPTSQTRRHAYLASLMGIEHILLAINKMDLVSYNSQAFRRATEAFELFADPLGFKTISAIPLCALHGDNFTQRSSHTPWYSGPTLLAYLETVNCTAVNTGDFAFPIQWINRSDTGFIGYSGSVAQGKIKVGDAIRVTGSGETADVADIVTFDGSLAVAQAGQAVTLKLNREIAASRGDLLSLASAPIDTTDQFEAMLVWLDEDPGLIGRNYSIKLTTQWATASLTNIKFRVNVNSHAHEAAKKLELNDIAVCNIAIDRPLAYNSFQKSKTLGSFILVDRSTNATVAAGVIKHSLRRAQNVHRQLLTITRKDREALNQHKGRVIWFTGLSGSGKSTIANALEIALHARGQRTYILDGDNVRQGLNKDLGFTDADRVENIRRIAEVAKLMMDAGLVVITAFISPFRSERAMAKELIGLKSFIEIYVNTSLETCEQRDVKGLYKKARRGLLPNMSGIDSAYEAPNDPHAAINGDQTTIDENVKLLMELLKKD